MRLHYFKIRDSHGNVEEAVTSYYLNSMTIMGLKDEQHYPIVFTATMSNLDKLCKEYGLTYEQYKMFLTDFEIIKIEKI